MQEQHLQRVRDALQRMAQEQAQANQEYIEDAVAEAQQYLASNNTAVVEKIDLLRDGFSSAFSDFFADANEDTQELIEEFFENLQYEVESVQMVHKSAAVEPDMTAAYAVAGVAAFAAGAFLFKKLAKKQTNPNLKEKMVAV